MPRRALRRPSSRSAPPATAPSPRASGAYRALLGTCRLAGKALRLRFVIERPDRLPRRPDGRPAGGWIAAGLPHRTWIEPFAMAFLLPVEPRLVFLGDGRAIYRSRLRGILFRAIDGVVPIWPGGGREAFESHVEAVRRTIDAGAVFALFPEVGPPVPPDRARPVAAGVGYFALRSGAPVVPLVFGGTDELYLGRTIRMRVLPPISARELAGLPPDAALPAPGSREERAAAHRIAAALDALVAPEAAELYRACLPRAGTARRLRALTHLLR